MLTDYLRKLASFDPLAVPQLLGEDEGEGEGEGGALRAVAVQRDLLT